MYSYIKKCIANRRIFSTGLKHNFARIIFFILKTLNRKLKYYDLVLVFRKSIQNAISVFNPIWTGKLHSYIKKCITNRSIFSTGSKHNFRRIVNHILHITNAQATTEALRFCSCMKKQLQDAIFVSNPIWAGKLYSYIKKCIINRRISAQVQHIFLQNREPYFIKKKT